MIKSSLNVVVSAPVDIWPYSYPDNPKSSVLQFTGPDNQELYQRNLKNLPDTWIYREHSVEYNFNKDGLRMNKDLSAVESDYILFSGTSYGMGIGLSEHDRYSEKISEYLNMDFINHCGPTYSSKMQIIAFFNLLKTNNPLPKILIIEYAPSNGHTFYLDGNFICLYTNFLKHIKGYHDQVAAYKLLSNSNYFLNETHIHRNMLVGTCKRLGIKLIELSFQPNDKFVQENNIIPIDAEFKNGDINYYLARDVRVHNGNYSAHPGIGIHQEITNKILTYL
jgi:hypothetical protein